MVLNAKTCPTCRVGPAHTQCGLVQVRGLPHLWQAGSWCRLGNDLGLCSHFTPAAVEPLHKRHEVLHRWRRPSTEIQRERAGESERQRSQWARGWPPPDSTGFRWESLGSSDGLNSWTCQHTSLQNVACVVSGKVARPIRATDSRKLPVVWQGPYFVASVRNNWFIPMSGIIGPELSVSKYNWLHVYIFWVVFTQMGGGKHPWVAPLGTT